MLPNFNNNLPQNVFHQIFGGDVNGVAAEANRWQVNEAPLHEPSASAFANRLQFAYNGNFMIPGEVGGNTDWNEGHPVLVGFTTRLAEEVQGIAQVRIYLRLANDHLQLVEQVEERAGRGTYFTLVGDWRRRIRVALAIALSSFLDTYYQDEDVTRNLSDIRLYVDLAPMNGGAGRLKAAELPDVFPKFEDKTVIFNPAGKTNCLARCLSKSSITESFQELVRNLGLIDNEPYVDSFEKILAVYPKYSLRLLSVSGLIAYRIDGKEFEFEDNEGQRNQPAAWQHQSKCIYLILEGWHYYLVHSVAKYCRKVKDSEDVLFCHGCCLIFNDRAQWMDHLCVSDRCCERCQMLLTSDTHKMVHQNGDQLNVDAKQCHSCRQVFLSTDCRDYHLLHCLVEKKNKNKKKASKFQEGKKSCFACHIWHEENDVCYMKANELPENLKYEEWWAFDFESMLCLDTSTKVYNHQVNLICVQKMFERPIVRKSFKDMQEFFEWLNDEIVEKEYTVAFIAHNLKGYDGRLTIAKLFELQATGDLKWGFVDEMVWEGAKIQTFKWKNIVFRDSLMHIAQPLSNFPKIFGLDEMHKGYFPYIFNTPENQNYVGEIPSLKYYEPQFKSKKVREELIDWYGKQKGKVYDFQQELLNYCISDVDILALSLEKYNDAGKQLNHEMLPPLEKLTTASYTLNCWKTLHFPESKLAFHTHTDEKRAREALRGGRTDVRCFYKKWSMDDVFVHKKYGKYVDVQSMYPFVMFVQSMPCGKPLKLPGTMENLQASFGFACVDISPPSHYVHHPVLVHRYNEKLVGHLLEWKKTVFTTVEIKDAIEQGWTVDHVYWVSHYDQDCDMFKDYIRKLIREKNHASQKDPSKDFNQLKRDWWDRFQIEMDEEKMIPNSGVRNIAKFQVNSLWGKLAECAKTEFSKNVNAIDYLNFEAKERIGAINFKIKFRTGPDSWFISGDENKNYGYKDRRLMENRTKTNVAIGAFVTMWGRRMLWEEMEKLGKRVLYHDTDSIVYEYDESKYNTPIGDCLGDWTDELEGRPMIEFVALAPKTYAYRYLDEGVEIPENADSDWYKQHQPFEVWENKVYPIKEVIKVKGFRLHDDAMKSINFQGLLDLFTKKKISLQAQQIQFKYDQAKGIMTTANMMKDLVFKYSKGVVGLDNLSYPFGVENYLEGVNGVVEVGAPFRKRQRSFDENHVLEELRNSMEI